MEKFEKIENLVIGESYYYKKHKSGLPVYVFPKKHSTAFAVFGTKYGSIDAVFKTKSDKDFTSVPDGVAHFLEHKLFEEENGGDATFRYAQFGGSANAYTSFTRTAYLFSCTNNFDDNLEILLDFVTHPYFTEASIAKEQGIIGEEIRMYEDLPGWRVYFNMLECLYVNSPMKKDIGGTLESIAQITPEILYKCYNTFYNLNNMALCVCGDVTPEQVEAVCDKILQASPPVEIEAKIPNEPEEINCPRMELQLEVAKPLFNLAIKDKVAETPGKALENQAINEILLQLLFGKSSEFYNNGYESGLIDSKLSAEYENSRGGAFAVISGTCHNPDKVMEAVKAQLAHRHKAFFTPEEFKRAQKVVYANNMFTFDSTEEIANSFLAHLFAGNNLLDYPEVVSRVTYEKTKEYFDKVYTEDKCVISIISPKNKEA